MNREHRLRPAVSGHAAPSTSPEARLPALVLWMITVTLLFCLGTSCGDEENTGNCPTGSLGIIHGTITAPGDEPLSRTVRAEPLENRYQLGTEAEVISDSTGWYELVLPFGDYLLSVSADAQIYVGRDTLLMDQTEPLEPWTVSGIPLRCDIRLGALDLDCLAPEALEGVNIYLKIVHAASRGPGFYGKRIQVVDGRARLHVAGLAPGYHNLACRPSSCEEYWLPGVAVRERGDRIYIDPSHTASYTAVLTEPWLLSGSVTGSWQTLGLAAPSVHLFTSDSVEVERKTLPSDGMFFYRGALTEGLRLRIDNNGLQRWVGGHDLHSATVFRPSPGETLQVHNLVGSAIECRLHFPDPSPGERYRVLLREAASGLVTGPFSPRRSDPLTIPGLEAGDYYLRLVPHSRTQDWCPQWFQRADELSEAQPITVPPDGGVVRIEMTVSPCGSICGRILSSTGEPAGNMRVEIFDADDPSQGAHGASDIYALTDPETGGFCIAHINDGDYRIGVRYSFSLSVWYPGTYVWDEATVLQLRDHGAITDLEWSLIDGCRARGPWIEGEP